MWMPWRSSTGRNCGLCISAISCNTVKSSMLALQGQCVPMSDDGAQQRAEHVTLPSVTGQSSWQPALASDAWQGDAFCALLSAIIAHGYTPSWQGKHSSLLWPVTRGVLVCLVHCLASILKGLRRCCKAHVYILQSLPVSAGEHKCVLSCPSTQMCRWISVCGTSMLLAGECLLIAQSRRSSTMRLVRRALGVHAAGALHSTTVH
jgi:hypothetical protein